MPRAPYALLGPLLRHELQHAVQWTRSGTPFFILDGYLRDAASRGDLDYFALPSERDANIAAAEYAVTLPEAKIAPIRKKRRYRQIVDGAEPFEHALLDEMTAAVRHQGDKVLPQLDAADRTAEIDRLESNARTWPATGMVEPDRTQPGLVVVKPYNWRTLLAG
jgi:hypothetical protein